MEFEYTISEDEYVKYHRQIILKRTNILFSLPLVCSIILLPKINLALLLIAYLFIIAIIKINNKETILEDYKTNPLLSSKSNFFINEEIMETKNDYSYFKIELKNITAFRETKYFLFFYNSDGFYNFIPKRIFNNTEIEKIDEFIKSSKEVKYDN